MSELSEEDRMIKLYELLHGKLSSNCYWDYDIESHILTCMKDGNECWSVTREELTFDYITRDMA